MKPRKTNPPKPITAADVERARRRAVRYPTPDNCNTHVRLQQRYLAQQEADQ